MKRALILIALMTGVALAWAAPPDRLPSLLAPQAEARTVVVVGGGVPAAATAFCPACTGALRFCWEITTDSATITESGGCTQGKDTVATLSTGTTLSTVLGSGKTGYAITTSSTYDNALFDENADAVINDEHGTLQFDVYVDDVVSGGAQLFRIIGEANNDYIEVRINSSDGTDVDITLAFEGSNSGETVARQLNLAEDTWYTCTAKWRTDDMDPNLSLDCTGTPGVNNTNLTAWDTYPDNTDVVFGNQLAVLDIFQIKNIKIWDTWQ